MTGIALAVAVVFAVVLAWFSSRVLVTAGKQRPSALDDTAGGLRKVHRDPTPRIGGGAVALGVFAGAGIAMIGGGDSKQWLVLLACSAPGLVWGLIEDLSKRGDVLVRLTLTAAAASMGYVLLDARLIQVDVPGIDNLLAFDALSFAFTVFAVTGVAQATNVIDGLNGLSGITTLLASIGLATVAWMTGDSFIVSVACVLGASIAGFLFVNFPSGRIFLGDGGAYFIGLLLAELSVLLVQRNSEVSPWFPLVLLAYPVWETLFSMYRRRRRGHPTGRADALHLHSLVYRRIVRWRGFAARPSDIAFRNSLASMVVWTLPLVCFSLALTFWNDTSALVAAGWSFNALYVLIYLCLVRFRIPAWLVIRAKKPAEPRPAGRDDPRVAVSR